MLSLHSLAAVLATALLGAGIDGLGRLVGGHDLLSRWVRGWTLLWWPMALLAQVVGPRPAVWVGAGLVAAGAVAWAAHQWRQPRSALWSGLALLSGTPLYLAPPFFFDTLVYHLGLPWTWWVNDTYQTLPYHVFSHFPCAAPTVSLLPTAAGVPEAAAGLHWLSLTVALVGACGIARRLGAGGWAWLAPASMIGCWHLVWVAGQAAADLLALAALVAAADAALDDRARPWDLGLACGLAAAVKYPAVVPMAALLAGSMVTVPRRWRTWLAGGGIAAVSSSFTLVRNLVTTGNPVYPLLWPLVGGSGWTARDQARWAALVHEGVDGLASIPSGLIRLVAPPGGLGWWSVVALPLVLLALGGSDRAAGERRRLAVILALLIIGWLTTSQTNRYAFPIAAVVAILGAAGAGRLTGRASTVAVAGLGLGLVHGAWLLLGFCLGVTQLDRLWTGSVTPDGWRATQTVNDPLPAYRATLDLPSGSRLLVVGEGRSWGCPVDHHVSSPYDLQLLQAVVEQSADAAAVSRRLVSDGWTHLLINHGELARLGGPDFQVLRWGGTEDAARWRRFLADCTDPVSRHGPCEIRALRAPRSPGQHSSGV